MKKLLTHNLFQILYMVFCIGGVLSIVSCTKKDPPVVTKMIIEHDTIQHSWNQVMETYSFQDQDFNNAFSYRNGGFGNYIFFFGKS
jgi:hypothetical protein